MALYPQRGACARNQLRGLALCAGFGGLELGLHVAEPGYQTVCYVERETFAAATLVARMADQALDNAPVWDDVKTFDGRPWRGKVGLLTAGYPCQPFTFSGKRRGTNDSRHLWPDVARIIREVQPEWVFCENVEGHVNLGFAEVAEEFQGMGFKLKAGLFSAYETGASHHRRRLFMLAHANRAIERVPVRVEDRSCRRGVCDANRPEGFSGRFARSRPLLDNLVARLQSTRHEGRSATANIPTFAPAPSELEAWDQVLARRPDLQPDFSDWLMGWPIGWSDPEQPVTAWSHWLQRSRGALSEMILEMQLNEGASNKPS